MIADLGRLGDDEPPVPDRTSASHRRVPVVAEPPLRWISPNAIAAHPVMPPLARFTLRAAEYRPPARLETRQDGRPLARSRRPLRLIPGRPVYLRASWLASIDPGGGAVRVGIENTGLCPFHGESGGEAAGWVTLDVVLRSARGPDGLPIATTEAIVPAALASGLDRHDFSTASLYDVLRTEYQVFPSRGKFVIQAGAAASPVSDRLEISPGDPVLIYSQTGYERGGRAFEVAKTVYRADRYLFRGTLVTDSEGTAPVIRETR